MNCIMLCYIMEYLKDEKHDLTVPNDMNPDPLGFFLGLCPPSLYFNAVVKYLDIYSNETKVTADAGTVLAKFVVKP